ncbi:MAG: TraR/DksA C4-type zinc finger protein [Pseudomonadota bacterium]
MSELDKEQLAELKQRLDAELKRLREDIRGELLRGGEEQYSDLVGSVHDVGEESFADIVNETNAAILGQSIRELREVEAAQVRIEQESYGECETCGIAIPFERLKANPEARRCLPCQEQHEKKQ